METKKHSETITAAIDALLKKDAWNYTFNEDDNVFLFGFTVKGNRLDYIIRVLNTGYRVYAVYPISANTNDAKITSNLNDFFCQANFQLDCGDLDFDKRKGTILFRDHIDCDNLTPTDDIIRISIVRAADAFNRYSDGIVDILFKGATADEAMEHCNDNKP